MASRATASRQILFTRSLGTVTAFISCDDGDIVIDYIKPEVWNDDSNYIPNLSDQNTRMLELNVYATGAAVLKVSEAVWEFNGRKCSDYPDYFETSIVNEREARLTIKGNIAKLTHNQSIVITCRAKVAPDGALATTSVNAAYNIPVRQQVKDTYRCSIAAKNKASNYTIKSDTEALGLECITYDWQGNVVSNELPLHYAWAKMTVSEGTLVWEPIGGDSREIEIWESQVDSQALLRVQVTLDDKVIAADTQVVYDSHDPYYLDVKVSPEDERIIEGDPAHAQLEYKVAMKKTSDDSMPARAKFSFYLYDTVGVGVQDIEGRNWHEVPWVPQNAGAGQIDPTKVAFTVTADDFQNGGNSLYLEIVAETY